MSEELKQQSQNAFASAKRLRGEIMYAESIGGVSQSNALANREHLPASVKVEDFTTAPSTKNKQVYTESLAKAALFAITVAVVAGLGYLAWRLLQAKPVAQALRSTAAKKALDTFAELKKSVRLLYEFPLRYSEGEFVDRFMASYQGIIAPDYAHGKSEAEQYKNLLSLTVLSYFRNDHPNRITVAILVGKYEFLDKILEGVIRELQPRLSDFTTKFMPKLLDHYKRNGATAELPDDLHKLMLQLVDRPDDVRKATADQTAWLERNAPGLIGPTDTYKEVAVRFTQHLSEKIKLDPYADQIDWINISRLEEPKFSSYDSVGKQFGDLTELGNKLKQLSTQFKGTQIGDKDIEARIELYIEDMQIYLDVIESTAKACEMEIDAIRTVGKAIADAGREIYKTASKVAKEHEDEAYGKKLYGEFEKEIRAIAK